MSDLNTYKAKFPTKNRYLKYFCDHTASDWTLKKYQAYFQDKSPKKIKSLFFKNLRIIKQNSKDVPSTVNKHLTRIMKATNVDRSPSTSDTSTSRSPRYNHFEVYERLFSTFDY